MIFKIALIYLIGFVVSVIIRVVEAKIALGGLKDRELIIDTLKFSLLWFLSWPLFFLFLAMDKIKERRIKKAVKPIADEKGGKNASHS